MEATGRTERAIHNMALRLGLKLVVKVREVVVKEPKAIKVKNPRVDHFVDLNKKVREPRVRNRRAEKIDKPKKVQAPYVSLIEYCPVCCAPVSNWSQHYERLGHRRVA